ncbi:NADH dehydrogenase 1 beta subcomplex subunit 8 ndufb8 [Borealophlyctis nickersoniae]|nr:NADH dehydrogenase 1 beta subcomplex subunit 8 ndufb8 [Borealophlyctis nickersoniae]
MSLTLCSYFSTIPPPSDGIAGPRTYPPAEKRNTIPPEDVEFDPEWLKKPQPDQPVLTPVEIWTRQNSPEPYPDLKPPKSFLYEHPLYAPLIPEGQDTSIGPLIYPLHYPEYDQSFSRIPLALWEPHKFPDHGFEPIGDYPNLPVQFAELRDPWKYWDQQGRRNYGEILHPKAHLIDEWSLGPFEDWKEPLKYTLQSFGYMALLCIAVVWWDPEKHWWFVPRDYPFDGLRVELGGDPYDPTDKRYAARTYELYPGPKQ